MVDLLNAPDKQLRRYVGEEGMRRLRSGAPGIDTLQSAVPHGSWRHKALRGHTTAGEMRPLFLR